MFPTPNVIQKGDGFYVSYNAVDHAIYGSDTTALVVGQMEHFYILDGDHRAAYRPLIAEGLDACLSYFKAHASEINQRSERLPEAA